jgi:NAD(P)-dependent dehydrogenase (short-subunit alcohol dehydrogenase family)
MKELVPILDKMSLAGKVAVVTGCGSGLGPACVRALAEAGANMR